MIDLDELFEHIKDLEMDLEYCNKKLEYHSSFLSWKGLWDDFAYFHMNAHLEYPKDDDDDPFPRYVL
jgi:hypothetical protein